MLREERRMQCDLSGKNGLRDGRRERHRQSHCTDGCRTTVPPSESCRCGHGPNAEAFAATLPRAVACRVDIQ